MDAIIKSFAKQVAEDGRKTLRSLMRDVSKRVEKDFMEQAQMCLDNYYREYSPTVYDRTYNLRDNGFHPYKRYRRNEIDIGVAFSPQEMEEYNRKNRTVSIEGKPYLKTIEDLVVDNAMQGIHGKPSIYTGVNIDDTMMHFASSYSKFFLDGYFKDAISKL